MFACYSRPLFLCLYICSHWSDGGMGGSQIAGGIFGASGSALVALTKDETIVMENDVALYSIDSSSALNVVAQQGRFLVGGTGAGGAKGVSQYDRYKHLMNA